VRWTLLLLVGCATSEPAQTSASPVQSVSVAPHSTGSPNEPTLLLGTPKSVEPRGDSGDVEHVKVKDEQPDASWKPPKDRCPDGVTEMIAVHVALGDAMELAPGASAVSALGTSEAVDVVYDRTRRVVQITARKYGLVFVLTERGGKCTWYGVNAGY
jgi:hypothetical protein